MYSQNNEDSKISEIFSDIGFTNKTFVEFGFHHHENNSRSLIENHNFSGLFIDQKIPLEGRLSNIKYHECWITRENIDQIISNYYQGSIDFLSIDVDGVDLYLWDSINCIRPRVVCIEYCASIGSDKSVTVKYSDSFDRHKEHPSGFYCNASLQATINIGKKKGYNFVGSVAGLNAFFVRDDIALGNVKTITCKEGWEPHRSRTFQSAPRWDGTFRAVPQEEQYSWISNLEWVNVSEGGIIQDTSGE